MKKSISTIFVIIISCLTSAQDYKMIYEFKWKSEPKESTYKSELTLLTNDGKNSYFEALSKFKYDSLKTEMQNNGFRSFPSPKEQWKLQTLIVKDLQAETTSLEQEIFDKVYVTKYSCKPKWTIINEKTKIFGYSVQKAETIFGGRKWFAWFTTEIPINDGPYKFFGLPGLILQVNDLEDNFIFEIKAVAKEKSDISKRNKISSIINLSPTQWNQFWEKYKKEPSNIFGNLNSSNQTYSYVYHSKNVDTKEAKDAYNNDEQEKINVFKNPIELNTCE